MQFILKQQQIYEQQNDFCAFQVYHISIYLKNKIKIARFAEFDF